MRTNRADSFQEHQTTVTECSQRTPSSQLTAQQPDLIEDEEMFDSSKGTTSNEEELLDTIKVHS